MEPLIRWQALEALRRGESRWISRIVLAGDHTEHSDEQCP